MAEYIEPKELVSKGSKDMCYLEWLSANPNASLDERQWRYYKTIKKDVVESRPGLKAYLESRSYG